MSKESAILKGLQGRDLSKWIKEGPPQGWNTERHNDETPTRRTIWTSKASLATGTFTPWYPPNSGEFVSARVNLSTAGSTQTKVDILIDGNSCFMSANLITVEASNLFGRQYYIFDRPGFAEDSKIQVKIDTLGTGAGGPMVVTFRWIETIDF